MCQMSKTHSHSLKVFFFKKDEPFFKEKENTFFTECAARQTKHSLMSVRLARLNFERISHDESISNFLGGGTGGTGKRIC